MDITAIQNSRVYKIMLSWHILATLLSILIGIVDGDLSLAIALVSWTIIVIVLYHFRPYPFIMVSFLMAIVEEWLVYKLGGGLQGEAVSLLHDFVNALPVFLGIIFGLYIVLKRYNISEVQLYLLAGFIGSFIELVFQGIIFNPILLLLLGGPNFFIYGSIAVVPRKIDGEREFGTPQKLLAVLIVFLCMILGAIVADNMNNYYGFS